MAKTVQEINNASRRKIYYRQSISFHKVYDKDCIDKLETVESKPAYIKALIRADIAHTDKDQSKD